MTTVALSGSGNWVVPAGVTTVRAQLWGGCGSGGGTGAVIGWNGGGGGGGEYAEEATYAVTPGASVAYAVGAGGPAKINALGVAGGNTTFGTITAHGGLGGNTQQSSNAVGGTGGTGSAASIHHNGGTGGTGTLSANSGGGGGGAGTGANGNNAAGITGGGAVTGGAAGPNGTSTGNGTAGTAPNGTTTGGSGGAGAYSNTAATRQSGAGGAGQILLTYTGTVAANPYLMGSATTGGSTTATTSTISTGSSSGDAIVVMASTSLAAATSPAGVSDSQGNSYVLSTAVISNLAVWVADGPTPLTTSDTVTFTWSSSTGSIPKDVLVIGVPGAATVSAVDPATGSASGSGTAVSATTGTPATAGDIAIMVISNSSSGGTPTSLGSFTSISTIQAPSAQFLTAAYQQLSARSPVTGSATITSTAWAEVVLLLSPTSVAGGAGAVVGATIEAGSYGGSIDADIATWTNSVINPGRGLDSIRVFFGPGNIPASMASGGLTRHAGVRRVLMSFKPGLVGSGNEAGDKSALNAFLASCKAGGLDAKVALYHEPDSAAGLTASQYKTMIQYYSATVRTYYPLVYCKAAYRTHVDPASPGNFYPGDAFVDECAYDFYEYDWRLYGQTMDSMAVIADGAGKPLSAWELGVVVGGVNGTTAGSPGKATQAQGTAYMNYNIAYWTARNAAGKPIGDVSYYDYINASSNWDHVIQPGTYLAPLYDALYDGLQAAAAGTPPPAQLSSQIDVIVDVSESVTAGTSGTAPGGTPAGSSGIGWPQLTVEAGMIPAAPVVPAGTFILGDPVNGKLGTGRLGPSTAWTDLAGLARSITIVRPSSRVQGPLTDYQPATIAVTFDNSDGRFDPDNTGGPYANPSGGTLIRPMLPIRVRAQLSGTGYGTGYGFADGWNPSPVTYEGGYAELVMTATDAFKVLGGRTIAAAALTGDGENSGARIHRILDAAGWYTDHRNIAAGDTQVQGTTMGDTALSLMQLTARTEIGDLYADGSGNVVFRDRHAILTDTRSNTSQALFGDAGENVAWQVQFTGDGVTANPGAQSQLIGGITAGNSYQASGWFYSVQGWSQGQFDINWWTAGGVYISTGSGPVVNVPSGTAVLISTGPLTAPGTATQYSLVPQMLGTPASTVTMTAAAPQNPPPGDLSSITPAWSGNNNATVTVLGSAPPAWYPLELPYASVTRASDDTTLANDVQITRNGSSTVQESINPASVATYLFPRTWADTTVLLLSDVEAKNYAQWVRYVSQTEDKRFDQITIDPLADPVNLFPQVLGRDIGDRITVRMRPANAGTVTRDCFIRGIQHDIDCVNYTWLTTWTLQDAGRYSGFLILGDPVFGKLGSNALAY